MTRTRLLTLALCPVVATTLILTSCSSAQGGSDTASMRSAERDTDATDTTGGSGSTDAGTVSWGRCANQLASMASLECGPLQVPLDPADPGGDEIELELARFPSTGSPDERIGSLVLNPGGPGGSGVEFLAGAAATFPDSLTDHFDLVSFDPRGVGESSPVRCLDDDQKDEQLTGDLSPDTPEEVDRAVRDQQAFLDGCESNSAKMLQHMSTADVAADLDLIREAVGDEQLTYLGFSYGTAIGATYATLFPENSRALVLDGSVSPDSTDEQETLAQAQGFEGTLANFTAACDKAPKCAIGPDSAATIASARQSLEQQPIEVETESGTREMGVDLFDIALATALYDTSIWGTAAQAIEDLKGDGGAVLLSLADQQTGRDPDGTFDNSSDSQAMVSCADSTERPSLEDATAAAERIRSAAPTFGQALAWSTLGCLDWPVAANPVPPLTGAGAPPILVVGTVGDPATPYVWAEQMTQSLESAVLLTYEGDGHTAFLRGGACIEDTVVDYLVELTVPDPGTRCPAQTDSVGFGGLSDAIVSQFVEAGLPKKIAQCVVDGIIDDIGEAEFNRLIMSNDATKLPSMVTAKSISCATSGGG